MTPPVYPSIGRRITAMLYEAILLFGVIAIAFLLPHTLLGVLTQKMAPTWVQALHLVALLMLYYVWCWLHGGQTLPMKTWKIKVINCDGSRLRPMQAVLRYLAAWPSLLLFGAGILWAVFDKEKQFLHDRIADTRLIMAPPPKR